MQSVFFFRSYHFFLSLLIILLLLPPSFKLVPFLFSLLLLQERLLLTVSNYIFTAIFVAEMTVKVKCSPFVLSSLSFLHLSSHPRLLQCSRPLPSPVLTFYLSSSHLHSSTGVVSSLVFLLYIISTPLFLSFPSSSYVSTSSFCSY